MSKSDALQFLTKQPGDPDEAWLTPSRHRASVSQTYDDFSGPPTLHAASHAVGGSDVLTPADIGAADRASMGNLLSANQASLVDGTTDGYLAPPGCTIEASTEAFYVDTHSLKMTATADGVAQANTLSVQLGPVRAGATVTLGAWTRAATVARETRVQITWRDADGNGLGKSPYVSVSNDTSGWVLNSVTAVVPEGATQFQLQFQVRDCLVGESHYFDAATVHVGAGGEWVPPGVPVPNLGIRANPADSSQVQVWNPGNETWITV